MSNKKRYLRCIDSKGCKSLEQFGVYLCRNTYNFPHDAPLYDVWDLNNRWLGKIRRDRFANIGNTNSDILDYGIEKIKAKLKERQKTEAKLKQLESEIKSIYKQVGKQLKLNL